MAVRFTADSGSTVEVRRRFVESTQQTVHDVYVDGRFVGIIERIHTGRAWRYQGRLRFARPGDSVIGYGWEQATVRAAAADVARLIAEEA